MLMTKAEKNSARILAAGLLLTGSIALSGCSSLSRFNNRMTGLVAPNQLARSSGGNFAATDSYLSALEVPKPSEQVLAVVRQLPKDDAMIFIGPDSEPQTELVYRTIAYLSWPRQIGALHCGAKGESPTLLFKPHEDKHIRWLIFYRRQVPAEVPILPGSIELGGHLKLIPVPETKEWNFYCSQ